MQEQNESKAPSLVARIGLKNIIWLSIFATLLLAAGIVWLWPHRTLPTATWREAHVDLPWEAETICVDSVRGHWESSQGNARMALRVDCYPVAEIELGESQGSGMLYVRFTDSSDRQTGDTINLYYDNGKFRPRQEVNITTEGNKARVFVEAGYEDGSAFALHQVDEHTPLWRINLSCRPEGSHSVKQLGYVTIPAELH